MFSIDKVLSGIEDCVLPASLGRRVGANFLALILWGVMFFDGHRLVPFGALIAAFFIHEFGHFIGMKVGRCEDASFDFGILGPIAMGNAGLSAGRKAIVALFGPAFGMMVAAVCSLVISRVSAPWISALQYALVYLSVLNLLPVRPFDGYAVVEHLVFNRYPKFQLFYLGATGVFLFLYSIYVVEPQREHPFYMLFSIGLAMSLFYGLKKADNMAGLITHLREKGDLDLSLGRYRRETVKGMEFTLRLFDISSDAGLSILLKEVWDKAWESPARRSETVIILAMYAMLIAGGATSKIAAEVLAPVL